MECPFCKSKNVEVPMVDIGVGSEQCGPAECLDCHAGQDFDGIWRDFNYWERSMGSCVNPSKESNDN